ncbi:hypothetical protein [Paenarthrobacter nitroguajacolicus]|uniref:hypothetical protein n=1 Tax=Paenarthrobacter nitroguajacolicus TaxID=211146 RepID=UPI0015BA9CAB|nr:hypothetical protein [Paenarthrobacter nitroguajacolicus]NWL32083.1 hypothetical protein [Paenarthrobacter nitroguajacolicus]
MTLFKITAVQNGDGWVINSPDIPNWTGQVDHLTSARAIKEEIASITGLSRDEMSLRIEAATDALVVVANYPSTGPHAFHSITANKGKARSARKEMFESALNILQGHNDCQHFGPMQVRVIAKAATGGTEVAYPYKFGQEITSVLSEASTGEDLERWFRLGASRTYSSSAFPRSLRKLELNIFPDRRS